MKNRIGFGQLCNQDKLRLQSLINELAKSNDELKQREKRIDELESKLQQKENAFEKVESAKSESDEREKRTKRALEHFRSEIHTQQNAIDKQIKDAMVQVTRIKEKRKNEQKQYASTERELRRQIDFHIETARSTENKAERIEAELAKLRCPKSEISIQTSFLQESEKTEEKSEESWEVKLREEQVKLQALVQEQGALLNKAVENLEKLEESRNLAKSTTSTTYLDLPTPRSTDTQTISSIPSNLAKLIADIEFEDELNSCPIKTVRSSDQSMTRLVDLIDELELNTIVNESTTSDVSSIQNDIIFEPELEELFFQ